MTNKIFFIHDRYPINIVYTINYNPLLITPSISIYLSISYTNSCSTVVDPCTVNPCQNGGTCQRIGDISVQCQCPPGFSGNVCSISRCHRYIILEIPYNNLSPIPVSVEAAILFFHRGERFGGKSVFSVASAKRS